MKTGLSVHTQGSVAHSQVSTVSNDFQSKTFLHKYLTFFGNTGMV